ncbi:MAG: NAD(P)-dependent glycerol-3-phosphate dehydrogenase [Aquificae bacterium]|nr:NAD(P)-dependent glycerol-3-phosphate dehydrogenase [Aquificota bacterium]
MDFNSITVLGAGSWGTALAQTFSENFRQVFLWGRDREAVNQINRLGRNEKYLPDVVLRENVKATADIDQACGEGDIVVVAVPSQHVRSVLSSVKLKVDKPVVSATKGIEVDTLKLITDIIRETLSLQDRLVFVLSGPSFAKEVALGLPTAVSLAGDTELGKLLQEKLTTSTFRLYLNGDRVGVQIGGAVKNVIAVATGVSDGLGLGNNARAGLITRGLFEMTKVAVLFGGKPQTLYGLSGMGDLVLTATGELSRNRTFGYLLGKGLPVDKALERVGQVVEGVKTVQALKKLIDREGVELPISEAVYRVVQGEISPSEAVKLLMGRQPASEEFPFS